MKKTPRKSGIDCLGEVPWGTYFCQFHNSIEELLEILVPYFKAGLENNEFCIWITSPPLTAEDAIRSMQAVMPDFNQYLEKGQIEFLTHAEWYLKDGVFDFERILRSFGEKLAGALSKGYDGMRVTGDTAWIDKKDWTAFMEYENGHSSGFPIIANCTYSLKMCTTPEVIEVTSKHQFALIKADSWKLVESSERKRRVREAGHAIQSEEVVDCVDGEKHVFLANKFPLFDSSGRMYGTGAISHDITGRKEAEKKLLESEQRYRGLYESIRDGIVRTDLEGRFLDCNQAFLDMLGYTKEELLKLSYRQITPAKWLVVSAEKIRNNIIGRGYSDLYEKEYLRKDGSACPISVRAWLIRDAEGNPSGMWGMIRDITEQKKAGEDIRKLNEELKDNVAKLEEANVELEAFNFSLAHDLSTPLRVIDGFAKMLDKYYSDKLDEEGKEFIRTIRGSAQKMGKFISDLLHLSRLGKSEIIKSAVDMTGLARPLSDELKTIAQGRDVEFRIKELPAAFGEPTLIRQVFFNLMENAVKFTKHREKAIIEIGGYATDNENIYYVKDNGVGFDMEHAGRVFGVFKRLHTEKEFEGTGAGLAIVQRIVQRHGGRVWTEGAVDKGATFYFSLPKG